MDSLFLGNTPFPNTMHHPTGTLGSKSRHIERSLMCINSSQGRSLGIPDIIRLLYGPRAGGVRVARYCRILNALSVYFD